MYDHVIWPAPLHPSISAIYGLNDRVAGGYPMSLEVTECVPGRRPA